MKTTSNGDPQVIIHHIVEMAEAEMEEIAEAHGVEPEYLGKIVNEGIHPEDPGLAALAGAFGMVVNIHNMIHDVMASPNLADLRDKGMAKKAKAHRPNFWDEMDDENKIKYMKALGRQ